jgi:hypothetical protein
MPLQAIPQALQRLTVNPQTNWAHFYNPQFMINYNSTDLDVENHVLSRVGSYGSQLSTILDVVSVLVAQLATADLTPQDRRYVDQFQSLYDESNRAVAEVRGDGGHDLTTGDVDRLIDDLRSLQGSDPEAHKKLTDRLLQALTADPAS